MKGLFSATKSQRPQGALKLIKSVNFVNLSVLVSLWLFKL